MVEDVREQIMEATFAALCRKGYAGLTIEAIADEFDKSKSLIMYHYSSKDEIMEAFLEYMTREMEADLEAVPEDADPFDSFLDTLLNITDDDMRQFRLALLELRAQAPHNEAFREAFAQVDTLLLERCAAILADRGVKDPNTTADVILSAIDGEIARRITRGDHSDTARFKEELADIVSELTPSGS